MLGPTHDKPAGSYQRAEYYVNEPEYSAESVEHQVDRLADLIKTDFLTEDPPPWTVFPDPPCETFDAFLMICCGIGEVVSIVAGACAYRLNCRR